MDMVDCTIDGDGQPWERLTEETEIAWSAFKVFRDLPPIERTLRKAYAIWYQERNGVPPKSASSSTFSRWANTYAWRKRADLYELEADRLAQSAFMQARTKAAVRQAEIGQQYQAWGMLGLHAKFADPETGQLDPRRIAREAVGSLTNMTDLGIRMERTAMGEPEVYTGRTPNQGNAVVASSNLEQMSSRELAALGRLSLKAAGIEKSGAYDEEDELEDEFW